MVVGKIGITASFFFAVSAAAWGQAFSDGFENGASNWTMADNGGGSKWAVDATPIAGNGGGKSLNFNNGTNYDTGSVSGTAASTTITLNAGSTSFTFDCYYETESDSATSPYDKRLLTVTPGSGAAQSQQLGSGVPDGSLVDSCGAMSQWHTHTVTISPSWGTLKISFNFDSVDTIANTYKGWFIDNVVVAGSGNGGGGGGGGTKKSPAKEWNFDAGLDGWKVSSSDATVTWAADGSPASVSGSAAFQSSPNSLNYNNGTDFNSGGQNSGDATSAPVDLSSLSQPELTFGCNFAMETSANYDQRFFEISDDDFKTTLLSVQLLTTGTDSAVGDCAAIGTWHTHTVALDSAWGSVRFRFRFDSKDGVINTGAGWFLDDIRVWGVGAVAGSTQKDDGIEGKNGDHTINDTLCGGTLSSAGGGGFGLALLGIVSLLLAGLGRRLESPA